VFETENVTTMRYLLYPLFHPPDLNAIQFLDRDFSDVWHCFSLVRPETDASGAEFGLRSFLNRAVGL
jgi:hypothetical protein